MMMTSLSVEEGASGVQFFLLLLLLLLLSTDAENDAGGGAGAVSGEGVEDGDADGASTAEKRVDGTL